MKVFRWVSVLGIGVGVVVAAQNVTAAGVSPPPKNPIPATTEPANHGSAEDCKDSRKFKENQQGCLEVLGKTDSSNFKELQEACLEAGLSNKKCFADEVRLNQDQVQQAGGFIIRQNPNGTLTFLPSSNQNNSGGLPTREYLMEKYNLNPAEADKALRQIAGDYGKTILKDKVVALQESSRRRTDGTKQTINQALWGDGKTKGSVESLRDKKSDLSAAKDKYFTALNQNNKDDIKSAAKALKTARQQKREAARTVRQDKREARQSAKKIEKLNETSAIKNENRTGQYGGLYGGAKRGTTEVINAVAQQMMGQALQANENITRRQFGNINQNVQQKGYNINQADLIKSNVEAAKVSAQRETRQAGTTTTVAALQLARSIQHLASTGKVNKNAATAMREVNDLRIKADTMKTPDGKYTAAGIEMMEKADRWEANIIQNQQAEKDAQRGLSIQQAMVAAVTTRQAMNEQANAKAARAQAEMLGKQAAQMGNNNFVFNPNPLNPQNPNDPSLPGQDPGGLQPGEELPGDQMAGLEPFDPNLNDGGLPGPAPGEFRPGEGANGAGGGMGGAGLAAGGTSAAQEGQGEGGEAPGKSQVGGSYASGDEGGGSRFGRGGSGGGIGDSLANFFEKFLPEKEQVDQGGKLPEELAERNLASDGPAVLGKNKNIFEEISKKYQKKSSEGAVAFSGDRS